MMRGISTSILVSGTSSSTCSSSSSIIGAWRTQQKPDSLKYMNTRKCQQRTITISFLIYPSKSVVIIIN